MITNLPLELIERIALYLDAAGLSGLRIASRGLSEKVFGSWVKCLHTIRVDLGAQSLQGLLAIGQDASLRDHVHALRIYDEGRQYFGQDLVWRRDSAGNLLITNPNDQFRLVQTCLCNQLRNCRSFFIEGGEKGQNTRPGMLSLSEAVILILNIVAETGLAIQSFSLKIDPWLRRPRLEHYLVLQEQPRFRQGWSSLQELQINVHIKSDSINWTRDMIKQAPKLRKLDLTFSSRTDWGNNDEILDLTLPNLEGIFLRGNHLTAHTLLAFLRPSQESLQRLSLRETWLLDGGRDDEGRCRDWKYLFRSLRADFTHLRSISLSLVHGPHPPMATAWQKDNRMNWPELAEHRGRLSEELPAEKFELETRIDTRADIHQESVLWVAEIAYEGRYMAPALERLEETTDYI